MYGWRYLQGITLYPGTFKNLISLKDSLNIILLWDLANGNTFIKRLIICTLIETSPDHVQTCHARWLPVAVSVQLFISHDSYGAGWTPSRYLALLAAPTISKPHPSVNSAVLIRWNRSFQLQDRLGSAISYHAPQVSPHSSWANQWPTSTQPTAKEPTSDA